MKLKNLYVIFIFCFSFYSKSQSTDLNKPMLANSSSINTDSVKSKQNDNAARLSVQESIPNNNRKNKIQQENLKVCESLKPSETVLQPENK